MPLSHYQLLTVNILATMHGNLVAEAIFFSICCTMSWDSSSDLRYRVALYMRDNEENMEDLANYGGYQCYCDLVGTCGFYVQGNAEVVATSDFISRHLLI